LSNSRAGNFITDLSGESAYKSFVPAPLPPSPPLELNSETIKLLARAGRQLAELNTLSVHIPNVNLFVSMYVRKEALMSSQIEGTQATLEDVLNPLIDANTNRNVAAVVGCIMATEFAVNRLKELPLCNRLIKETHAVLMQSVRGGEKNPGEFRRSQNWIGGAGSTLKNARYIPPNAADMEKAMSDLEKYINSDDGSDELVMAALIHYQFETVHPYLDGNGRVGRLLITLFLMKKGLLSSPALYISYFLKKNRVEYYDRLSEVRNKGAYEQWIKFFLEAVFESAKEGADTINKLVALRQESLNKISSLGRVRATANRIFDYLEQNPMIEIRKTADALDMAYNTVSASVSRLCDLGILVQSGGDKRGRVFSYEPYLALLRDGTQ